ncbi:NADP-dependent oxidoreductase [Rhodocista pekingensis]|uniref:NADP-dependent oxidoreductase n=1 Tax=Rhodocista pekingensis TaxID=201185 RepID=A0ABW2KZJ1_9PROT
MPVNRRIVLAERPQGMPTPETFRLEEGPVPTPGPDQVLLRTVWLSLDPYMRGRMSAAKSYAQPVEIGDVMVGGTVCEVVQSNAEGFGPGDLVLAQTGWQEYAVAGLKAVQKLDPGAFPPSLALGTLGMPGLTAYVGLLDIGEPRNGETVVVSAAAGAVGSVVGQIARIKGCRAVGIAGGKDKCDYVTGTLGFDACVDYKAPDFMQRLKEACPGGIDVYFDNVGGDVADACMALLNNFARVPVCGRIANYNDTELPPGPNRVPQLMGLVLTRRLKVQGFIVSDRWHRMADFHHDMGGWLRDGRIKYREDVVEGLEKAPEAFIGLLQGRNFGKLLVRVGPDRT